MVWLDSHQNEYKLLVLPLAETQPLLTLAIQTTSAAHVADGHHVSLDGFGISTMQLLTEEIASMVSYGQSMNDASLKSLLASTLILSNRSLLLSETGTASLHRQAARLVLQSLSVRRTSQDDDLVVFLQDQLAIYEILACTTLSNKEQIECAVMPHRSTKPDLFRHFLNFLHQVTIRSTAGPDENSEYPHFTTSAELVNEFELVMGETLLLASELVRGKPHSFRRDFIRLVSAYHHAGILYSLDRLQLAGTHDLRNIHAEKLLLSLQGLHALESLIHNLPWPIFILGTVARDDIRRQQIVRSFCGSLIKSTGFKHYSLMLNFLEDFWQCTTQS